MMFYVVVSCMRVMFESIATATAGKATAVVLTQQMLCSPTGSLSPNHDNEECCRALLSVNIPSLHRLFPHAPTCKISNIIWPTVYIESSMDMQYSGGTFRGGSDSTFELSMHIWLFRFTFCTGEWWLNPNDKIIRKQLLSRAAVSGICSLR